MTYITPVISTEPSTSMPHFKQISMLDSEEIISHLNYSTCQLYYTHQISERGISDSRTTISLYYQLFIVYWLSPHSQPPSLVVFPKVQFLVLYYFLFICFFLVRSSVAKISISSYADDNQLYVPPNVSDTDKFSHVIACLSDITYQIQNILWLNESKSEILLFGSPKLTGDLEK